MGYKRTELLQPKHIAKFRSDHFINEVLASLAGLPRRTSGSRSRPGKGKSSRSRGRRSLPPSSHRSRPRSNGSGDEDVAGPTESGLARAPLILGSETRRTRKAGTEDWEGLPMETGASDQRKPGEGYQNPKCYARALRGCGPKISGEHRVSRSVLELVEYGRGVPSKGVSVRKSRPHEHGEPGFRALPRISSARAQQRAQPARYRRERRSRRWRASTMDAGRRMPLHRSSVSMAVN